MDKVFSVENMSDQFWSSHPTLNRSSSEWAFQSFLREAVTATSAKHVTPDPDPHPGSGPGIPVDSEEYQAFLKNKLDLACKAVALTRANCVISSQESSTSAPDIMPPIVQIDTHTAATGSGHDLPKKQDKDVGGSVAPSLPAVQKKLCFQVRSTTSGSSGDQSDDDEVDCGTIKSLDPADAKRRRRMLSNRESARRSRRRKQAHLTELETKVSELRVENSSLTKRLTDASTKYNEVVVDNRVLKADVETLRAKVKMAEETVKRITGLNPFLQTLTEISTMMPTYSGSPSDTSTDTSVPVQHDPKQQYHATPSSRMPSHDTSLADIPSEDHVRHPATAAAANKMERTSSMHRVASLEHLQKRIRGETYAGGK
ncbi:basic leucine zipper transcription factor [Lithospermum erythrorhizon]|uniref:Basic leucine zipper transcription factor n=1 Tax=Lithospermum erythrorhizon TaxID=34254 RepID=A0AAV3RSV9_LITER